MWADISGRVDMSQDITALFDPPAILPPPEIGLPDSFVSLYKNKSAMVIRPRRYLFGRGLSEEDFALYKIGYCTSGKYRDRVIVPSFDRAGRLNYFVARALGSVTPKYFNPPTPANLVFNECMIDWDEPIILVEGVFDAIKAGQNAIPLLGSYLRSNGVLFMALVMGHKITYLALDANMERSEMKLAGVLSRAGQETYIVDTTAVEDVGAMTRSQFDLAKKEAIFWCDEYYLIKEISGI